MQDLFVHVVTGDQCMYGLTTKTENGQTAPARKPTTFLTSSRQLADLLGTRCDRSHTHKPLISGRCANAAFYPLKLIQTISRGIRATADAENAIMASSRDNNDIVKDMINAMNVSNDGTSTPVSLPPSKLRSASGGAVPIKWDSSNVRKQ